MPNLIGTNANQVSTNGMLGTAAFADIQALGAQAALVSGTNIKTINGSSLLGAGNLALSSNLILSARTANTILGLTDSTTLIDITSGTFTQTFTAATALGSGWFCYLKNSGTGDITLDPNAAELIDGLTSYVMYPGEVRLVQCDGTALRSFVLNAFYRAFTSSGTFTKPPGYRLFQGSMWGGGGSGGNTDGTFILGGGGSGAPFIPFSVDADSLSASSSVVIGSGGAVSAAGTNGNSGGITTFLGIAAPGGLFGSVCSSGTAAAGTTVNPTDFISTIRFNGGCGGLGNTTPTPGTGSTYGGGGGGGGTNGVSTNGGASIFGGTGGKGAGTGGSDFSTAGQAPGGGGGGGRSFLPSGAGARGELRIYGVI